MAYVVQEMTVRLGSATHRGHAELIFDRFGPFWGWFSLVDLGIGNFLTLITEFIAIRAGLGFFGVPPWIAILGALAVLYLALVTHRYWTWERISLAAAAFNLVFIPVAFLARPDWSSVGHALMTWRPLPGGLTKSTLLILLADIGATVTPWMLFFQQSATVDKGLTKHRHGTWRRPGCDGSGGHHSCYRAALHSSHERRTFPSRGVRASFGALGRTFRRSAVCPGHGRSGNGGVHHDFYFFRLCVRRSRSSAPQLEPSSPAGQIVLSGLIPLCCRGRSDRSHSWTAAGVRRSGCERNCRAGHAAGARVSLHARERPGNHGRSRDSTLGECIGFERGHFLDRRRNSLRD